MPCAGRSGTAPSTASSDAEGLVEQNLLRQSVLPPDEFVTLLPAGDPMEIRFRDLGQAQTLLGVQ